MPNEARLRQLRRESEVLNSQLVAKIAELVHTLKRLPQSVEVVPQGVVTVYRLNGEAVTRIYREIRGLVARHE